MKKQDVISGVLLMGLSAVLYTQTLVDPSEIMFEDDIDPMKYPRLLILLLAFLGALLAGRGLCLAPVVSAVPIFSRRTLGIMAVLLVYAAVFTTVGECKFTRRRSGVSEYRELVRRASFAVKDTDNIRYIMFSRSGFTDELIEMTEDRPSLHLELVTVDDIAAWASGQTPQQPYKEA